MDDTVTVQIPVHSRTAQLLCDAGRLRAIGRVLDMMLDPARVENPLARVLEDTREKARNAGLSDKEIDAELEDFRAERAARRGG